MKRDVLATYGYGWGVMALVAYDLWFRWPWRWEYPHIPPSNPNTSPLILVAGAVLTIAHVLRRIDRKLEEREGQQRDEP